MPEAIVTLSSDEALVLFELLHRCEESGDISGLLLPGEQTALWALSCRLENIVVEPFLDDYRQLVDKAGQRLIAQGGP